MMHEYRGQTVEAFVSLKKAASATAEEPAAPARRTCSCSDRGGVRGAPRDCHRHNPFVASSGRTGNGFRAVAQG